MSKRIEQRGGRVYHVHMAKKRPTPVQNWPERLSALRERLGLTQAQAAEKVRVSLRAWAKWEHGKQIPSPSHQLLIALLEQEKI